MEPETVNMFYVVKSEPLQLPKATAHCKSKKKPVLAEGYGITMYGWIHAHKQLFPGFFTGEEQLKVYQGCLTCSIRIIIP